MSFTGRESGRLLLAASRPACSLTRPARRFSPIYTRSFADQKGSADKTVLPGSQSSANPDVPPAPKLDPTSGPNPSASGLSPESNVPKIPNAPPTAALSTGPATSNSTSSGALPKPKPRRRLRNLSLLLALLGLGYAGGIYLSLVYDNFHDFFTEYVPFGEEAVLYFEEREFKRRFGDRATSIYKLHPQTSGEDKVTVSGRSGVSARPASDDGKDESIKDKVSNAVQETASKAKAKVSSEGSSRGAAERNSGSSAIKKPSSSVDNPASKTEASPSKAPSSTKPKQAMEAPKGAAPTPIDLLKLDNAADPAVQTVTKILNDVITTINADSSPEKYSSTIQKAKESLEKLSTDVSAIRSVESKAAEDRITKMQADFENAAKAIDERVAQLQREQELKWRDEYEAERQRLAHNYQEKLKAEIEASNKVAEQRLRNELLEQNVKLNEAFNTAVRDRVEAERSSRLSRLSELSTSVSELENLTAQWGGVVEANVKTQHLVVAVDAIRSVLDSAERPTPFVHELAALKEIASDNSLVNAALASINPLAYQSGIPSASNLIDRFRKVASEVRKASLLPQDAGAASHAASFVLSKVLFKKQGLAAGDDVESILTRTETLLEEGNLDEATREMNSLTGWAKVLSRDWLAECRRVLEVRQAVEVLATEARLQSLTVR